MTLTVSQEDLKKAKAILVTHPELSLGQMASLVRQCYQEETLIVPVETIGQQHYFQKIVADQSHPFKLAQVFSIFQVSSPPFEPCFVQLLNFEPATLE